jgi:hypothetical protein
LEDDRKANGRELKEIMKMMGTSHKEMVCRNQTRNGRRDDGLLKRWRHVRKEKSKPQWTLNLRWQNDERSP